MTAPPHGPAPHDPEPGRPPAVGGERRLARPPSDRYGGAAGAGTGSSPGDTPGGDPAAAAPPNPMRGVVYGSVAALVGAALIVVFGGALAISAGLLVVAAAVGYVVGLAAVGGAGDTLGGPARSWIAAAIAGLGVVLGQAGLWVYARAEGGVLPPIEYLAQTFGPLVPLELLVAVGVAWWRAR